MSTTGNPLAAPRIGDHVRFRLDRGPNGGDYRPAVIVRTWPGGAGCNLLVFTDAINDDIEKVFWVVNRVEGQANGCWSRYGEPEGSAIKIKAGSEVDLVKTPAGTPEAAGSNPPSPAGLGVMTVWGQRPATEDSRQPLDASPSPEPAFVSFTSGSRPTNVLPFPSRNQPPHPPQPGEPGWRGQP